MAWSLVAHTAAQNAASSNSVTTSGINCTGANLIAVAVETGNHIAPGLNLSDSLGNSWSALTDYSDGSGDHSRMFYATAHNVGFAVGSGQTFTFSQTTSFPAVAVQAWSGSLASADPFDTESGAAAATTASTTVQAAASVGSNGELVVSAVQYETGGSPSLSINSSFTISDQLPVGTGNALTGIGMAYLAVSGAVNPTWTAAGTGNPFLVTSLAAFKAAATFNPGWAYGATQTIGGVF